MSKLFQERRQKHFLLLLKYWRLVFNDHFVIALFFLFGALAYGYAQWLPTVPAGNLGIELLLTIFLMVMTQLGRLATLVKRADPVFLLPQTSQMQAYFRHAYVYSWVLGSGISVIGVVVALPLVMVTYKMNSLLIAAVIVTSVLTKSSWLNLNTLQITLTAGKWRWLRWAKWLLPFITWLLTWLVNPWLGLLVSLVVLLITSWQLQHQAIDWRRAVVTERDRMATVYRFFNLFTDVPNMQGRVKRRGYLNPLVKWFGEQSVWSFLYGRGFVRNTEISDLVTRLTLLMAVVLIFVPVTWLNSAIMALALYLIAAQLMPLYDQFANNAFTYVYPVMKRDQYRDFSVLIRKVMIIVGIVLVICSIGTRGAWEQLLINVVIALIEIPLLTTRYLRYRIRKIEK